MQTMYLNASGSIIMLPIQALYGVFYINPEALLCESYGTSVKETPRGHSFTSERFLSFAQTALHDIEAMTRIPCMLYDSQY